LICFSYFKENNEHTRYVLKRFSRQAIGSITQQSSSEESFQNEVLRPILKLQNDLFLAIQPLHHKTRSIFYNLIEKKLAFIENAIQKTANLGAFKEWYSHSPSMSI
jgi:hypothetical protein